MKVTVSLPEEDLAFVDQYAKEEGYGSRSAVIHKAVRLLRASRLGAAYEDAWREGLTDCRRDALPGSAAGASPPRQLLKKSDSSGARLQGNAVGPSSRWLRHPVEDCAKWSG